MLTQYGNRDALTRIESRIQENHAVLVSHVRASQAGFTGIQQQMDSGANTLETRLYDHDTLLLDHLALSGELRNRLKIGVQKEGAPYILNASSKGYQESLSMIKGYIDGEAYLPIKNPTLLLRTVNPTSDVACRQDDVTQSAVNQAQCILQIKNEVMNMHQTLRTNSARLNAMEATSMASQSASKYFNVNRNTIDTLLAGLRLTTQGLCKRCSRSFSKATGYTS